MFRPKSLTRAFSTLNSEYSSKLKIINDFKENNFNNNPPSYLNSYFQDDEKTITSITQLQKDAIHFNFSCQKQRQFLIKQGTIKSLLASKKTVVIIITCNLEVTGTIKFEIDGLQRKRAYKIQGNKAILLKQYQNGDVKVLISAKRINAYSNAKIYIDTMQTQFQPKKKVIVSKIKKQEIQQFIKLNRGRSAQILRNRAAKVRQSHSSQRLRSGKSYKQTDQNLYRPLSSSGCKRQLKQINEFQKEKLRYINHMQKMSPQKGIYLQEKHQLYMQKKEQQVKNMVKLVNLANFAYIVRVKTLQYYLKKLKKIKIEMLCQDFCQIMKTKLRYKITQKARYRMTIKQSLVFSSQVFYSLFKPKAEEKVFKTLMQIQNYKTQLKLSRKSKEYLSKTIYIQRYLRKKKQKKIQAAKCIINMKIQSLRSTLKKQKITQIECKINQLSIQYVKQCYNSMEPKDKICHLHKNSDKIIKKVLQKLKIL